MVGSAQHDRRPRRDEGGFTLLETLVVIIVLAIVAGIVVLSVSSVHSSAQTSACAADYRTVQSAEEAYHTMNGLYATEDQLVAARWLHSASSFYDVNVSPAADSYVPVARDAATCSSSGGAVAGCSVQAPTASPASVAVSNPSGHLAQPVTLSVTATAACSGLAVTVTPGGNGFTTAQTIVLSGPVNGVWQATIQPNDYKWTSGSHGLTVNVTGSAPGALVVT